MKVLVIEDDFEHMRIVRCGLDEAGFVCDAAKTGAQGRDMLANGAYDVAILDRMLPDVDGLDVLRQIRGRGILTPVIVLSALGSTDERVRGLSAGADDYLAKPFSADELVARIYAVTRRVARTDDEMLVFKDISFDLKNRVVRRNGRLIDLTGLEYKLLELFMLNPGRKMSAGFILDKVWDFDSAKTNVVEAKIYASRKKLNGPGEEDRIVNKRGLGYALQ